jgi:hypothetical protein
MTPRILHALHVRMIAVWLLLLQLEVVQLARTQSASALRLWRSLHACGVYRVYRCCALTRVFSSLIIAARAQTAGRQHSHITDTHFSVTFNVERCLHCHTASQFTDT